MDQIAAEFLENARETYCVVKFAQRSFYLPETDCSTSFADIVRDIASGEHDHEVRNDHGRLIKISTPLAVIRFSTRDDEAEIVTEKVAQAVLDYRIEHDDRGPCPFLDQVMDGWRVQSGLHEEAA